MAHHVMSSPRHSSLKAHFQSRDPEIPTASGTITRYGLIDELMVAGTAAKIRIAGTTAAAISNLWRGAGARRAHPACRGIATQPAKRTAQERPMSRFRRRKTISWNDIVPRSIAADLLGDNGGARREQHLCICSNANNHGFDASADR